MHYANVRHVSFDLWLTLIKSNPVFKQQRGGLLKSFFKIPHPVEAITARIRMWDLRFNAINEASGRNLDASEMVLVILADLDVDLREIDPLMLEKYYAAMESLFMEFHPVLYEEKLIDYLGTLRDQGMTLSLLSNTGFIKGRTLKTLLQQLGIAPLLHFQIYSDEIKASKPSPEAYRHLLEQAKLLGTTEPGNILHIGDNAHADYHGAQRIGLQSALINSNQVSLLNLTIRQ